MHRSIGTCFVRNVLSSSKIVKRQMAARNAVGFQSKCGFSLEELQRQHQQQQQVLQEQCILLLGVEAPKKSSPTRFARYSQFSAIHRQRHKTEWFDLSPEKSFFREQFWRWKNLVVQYARLLVIWSNGTWRREVWWHQSIFRRIFHHFPPGSDVSKICFNRIDLLIGQLLQ